MRVVVTGATGFIGRALVKALRTRGDEVRVLARNPGEARAQLGADAFPWDTSKPVPADAMAGVEAVVHLAGEGIADKRWSEARKKSLVASRVEGTRRVVEAIAAAAPRPKVFVSGSAIGIYGDVPEGDVTETSAAGKDFLAELCAAWEAEAQKAEPLGVRVVLLRTGIVLGPGGGALGKMLLPFKLGAGGPMGSGKQWMSWIHLEDEVGLILHALDSAAVKGALNATAPAPARNRDFARGLGRALHRPAIAPMPGFALKLLVGEMAEVALLTGQKVLPAKAEATGYRFKHPALDGALQAAVA
jgi:uncharacterized protein